MKKARLKKIVFALFLSGLIFSGSSCGRTPYGKSAAYYNAARSEAAPARGGVQFENLSRGEPETDAAEPESPAVMPETSRGRKLVKKAVVTISVEDFEEVEKPVADIMNKYGAWTDYTRFYEDSRDYSIRVPADSYGDMLAELSRLGKLISLIENTEDVTLSYYDLEGRLETRRELLKTYRDYLGKANNIEDIMTVESKIADLQYEIDRSGAEFRNLAGAVDYSTITLQVDGPANFHTYSRPTLKEKLKELFGSFEDALSTGVVVFVGAVIYGVPALLAGILLFFLLFGRVGLLKKLWRLASGKKRA